MNSALIVLFLLLIVLLMIFMPMGLAGLLKDQYQKLRKLLTGKRKKTTAKESA